MKTPFAIYENFCPNCGGDISSERLSKGLFCKKCMPIPSPKCKIPNLKNFKPFCDSEKKFEEFSEFFISKVGSPPNGIQKMWAKRFFEGSSFAMLAPTGIGKTTFGLMLSAFVGDAYLIFPTKILVKEARERLEKWGVPFSAYTGKKEEKEKVLSAKSGIIITTSQFLYKNRDAIKRKFKLVFVDDVDSILKSGRKIGDVLSLLGFSDEDFEKAFKFAKNGDYESLEKLSSKRTGNVIVSSATANPRSKRVKLFLYLAGFEVSRPSFTLRNVSDLFEKPEDVWKEAVRVVKVAGNNGFLFLPGNETKETLGKFIEFLRENGIESASYEEFEEHKEDFKKGKIVFVGFASYRNPLARGVDMPEYVKYALFAGVPKMEFRINEENYKSLYYILLMLMPFLSKKNLLEAQELAKLSGYANYLKKYAFYENVPDAVREKLEKIRKEISEIVEKYSEEIASSPEISFDGEKIVVSDITGYLQATGRTSRFFKGKLTKGVSVLLVDNEKAFYSLRKRLSWFGNAEFEPYSDEKFVSLLEEAEKSRREEKPSEMKTSFVIVESPTKAKTISSFFGKPAMRLVSGIPVYEVMTENGVLVLAASVGHDFDLSDRGKFGVVEKTVPVFKILENKDKILKAFGSQSAETDEVLVATDPDREGEKISFDLTNANKVFNENIRRIEFHEISKKAFENAVRNKREVDSNLVLSQFARRIADRWIGFGISAYIQEKLGRKTLSAGRVQTPVLEWIARRTEKLKEKIWAVKTEICGERFEFAFAEKEEAEKFLRKKYLTVKKIAEREREMFVTPFNTPELLKSASDRLGFSPQKTMKIAQELFENGFITYHRTDSIRVSQNGISLAKDYIVSNFGEEYFTPRKFESAGGAHECIRPVSGISGSEIKTAALMRGIAISENHAKLYSLIFDRFIASQMRSAVFTEEEFEIEGIKKSFLTKVIKNGFNLVWQVNISEIKEGEYEFSGEIVRKPAVSPYTYAEIINEMREKGIGRPSTYAITVEKLLKRRYVVQKGNFVFATRLGFKVLKLSKESRFAKYVSENFTAELEKTLDEIASGMKDYEETVKNLYRELFEKAL